MKIFLSILILALTLMFNVNVHAARADGISKQQAVNIATQKHPGRVLGVKRKNNIYRVKTLSKKGKVRIVKVDADSGKIKSGK